METNKKDLLDMTQEEVNALTDEEVLEQLDEIGTGLARIRREIKELKDEQERNNAKVEEIYRKSEERRRRIDIARKRADYSPTP